LPARDGLLIAATAWLALVAASWAVAGATFRTADTVLAAPAGTEPGRRLERLAEADRRPLLRHVASEINRWMFARFGWAQLALALAAVALAWGRGSAPRILAVAALVLLVVQLAALAPGILALGRSVDFVPRPLPPDVGRRFGMLHGGYVLLDGAKALLLAVLLAVVARRP
jgi:hypothetical protein